MQLLSVALVVFSIVAGLSAGHILRMQYDVGPALYFVSVAACATLVYFLLNPFGNLMETVVLSSASERSAGTDLSFDADICDSVLNLDPPFDVTEVTNGFQFVQEGTPTCCAGNGGSGSGGPNSGGGNGSNGSNGGNGGNGALPTGFFSYCEGPPVYKPRSSPCVPPVVPPVVPAVLPAVVCPGDPSCPPVNPPSPAKCPIYASLLNTPTTETFKNAPQSYYLM